MKKNKTQNDVSVDLRINRLQCARVHRNVGHVIFGKSHSHRVMWNMLVNTYRCDDEKARAVTSRFLSPSPITTTYRSFCYRRWRRRILLFFANSILGIHPTGFFCPRNNVPAWACGPEATGRTIYEMEFDFKYISPSRWFCVPSIAVIYR